MKASRINTMLHIENGAQTIAVSFSQDAKTKIFLVPPEVHSEISVGDYVIVAPQGDNNWPRLVRVEEVHDLPEIAWETDTDYQWAALVTNPDFFKTVAASEAKLQVALRRAEARKLLTEAISELGTDAGELLRITEKETT